MNKFKLKPKQSVAWSYLMDDNYAHIRDIGYGGSAGGGKSILGSAWLITMAMKYPNTRYAAAAYDIKKAADSIYISLQETLRMMGLKDEVDFTYNVKRHTFTFIKTGSEIVLFGLTYRPQDPQNLWLGGYLFTCSWIDESNAIDSKVIDTFMSRNGRYGNEKFIKAKHMTDKEKEENPDWKIKGGYNKVLIPTKVLQTFNPSQNHVYSMFWLPYKNKKQTTSRFVRAFAWDNFAKDSNYIKNLKRTRDKVTLERLLYGSFEYNSSETSLFDSDAVIWMTENKAEHNNELSMVIDVSASGASLDKTIIAYFNGLDCYEIEEVRHENPEDLIDHIVRIANKINIDYENIVIDANGVGNEIAKSKKLKGSKSFKAHLSTIKEETGDIHVFNKGKNKISTRMSSNFHRLKDQCTWLLAQKVNDHEVTASFEHAGFKDFLKQELLLYEHINRADDKDIRVTQKKNIRASIGRSPDVSDVFMMRMYLELLDGGIKKAIPLSQRKFIKKKKKRINYE